MIVVLIGYGEENPIYSLCRKVWEMYLETTDLSEIFPIFVQDKESLSSPFVFDGRNLTVSMRHFLGDEFFSKKPSSLLRTVVASDWSNQENVYFTEKDKQVFRWVKEYFGNKCTHVYPTTVTSLPNFSVIRWLTKHLPKRNLYAGTPGVIPNFLGNERFVFLSGSGSLLSSDLLSEVSVSAPQDNYGIPNDVLRATKLKHIKKIYFPRMDFERSGDEPYGDYDHLAAINTSLDEGHFHFRVKSTHDRAKKDHLILFDVYKTFHCGRSTDLNALQKKLFIEN